jgi:hypothetical protein
MTLDEFLARLERVRPSGAGYDAACPSHEDDDPSLSVGAGDDGRILLHCHAGCSPEAILGELGLTWSDLFLDMTLESYAAYKQLPLPFLQKLGLRDINLGGRPAVEMPYRDEAGRVVAVKIRRSLTGESRFHWRRGDTPVLYGLDRLAGIRSRRFVVLVEGESDAQTLWLHKAPALGLPGANSWREEWAEAFNGLGSIFIIVEDDAGGEAVLKWLATSSIRERVWLVTLPTKDVSALYLEDPEKFRARFKEAIHGAVPWDEHASPQQPREDGENSETWQPEIVQLSSVAPREIEWLWRPRIAIGKLNLLVGDPDIGKSYLTLDIASRVTTGRIWPDGVDSREGSVILLSAEDALDDTVRPRLDRLGGDSSRIFALTMMRRGDRERMPSLVDDLKALEQVIQDRHACLVVIDVVNAYLGSVKGAIDSYRDTDIRNVLAPLAKMAERQRVAVLGLMHLVKAEERKALYRILGSIGYVGQARMVLSVSYDPRDLDQERRLLAKVKGNNTGRVPTLAFRINDDGLSWEPDPVPGMTADQALGNPPSREERSAREIAQEFLRARLQSGAQEEARVIIQEAKEQGISERTLTRVRKDIGARARYDGSGGKWYWFLPVRRFRVRHEPTEPEGQGDGEMPPSSGSDASPSDPEGESQAPADTAPSPDGRSVAPWRLATIPSEENANIAGSWEQGAKAPTDPIEGQGAKLDPDLRRQYEDAAARARRRRTRGSSIPSPPGAQRTPDSPPPSRGIDPDGQPIDDDEGVPPEPSTPPPPRPPQWRFRPGVRR